MRVTWLSVARARARALYCNSRRYITDVIKGVTTMHKVLQPQLPQEQLKEVYSRICELLNTKVPQHFEDVSPATPAGQQRVVDDVVHLATTLARLRAVQATQLTFEEHFRKRFPSAS